MITLEKLLTELKAESLNEIIAGCGGKTKTHKAHKPKSPKGHSGSSSSSSGKSYSCGCSTPPPPCGGPKNHGCQ